MGLFWGFTVYVLNCSTFYKNLNLHTFLVCISRCYHSSSKGGLNNLIAPKLILSKFWCTWGWGLLLTNRQITDNYLKEHLVAKQFFNATFSSLQYSSILFCQERGSIFIFKANIASLISNINVFIWASIRSAENYGQAAA